MKTEIPFQNSGRRDEEEEEYLQWYNFASDDQKEQKICIFLCKQHNYTPLDPKKKEIPDLLLVVKFSIFLRLQNLSLNSGSASHSLTTFSARALRRRWCCFVLTLIFSFFLLPQSAFLSNWVGGLFILPMTWLSLSIYPSSSSDEINSR